MVGLVDLPAFGRPVRLMWHKWRWRCPAASCDVGSFTEVDEQIAPARSALTARAGRWPTVAVGRDARPVADVAAELGCDWHTANRAVLAWGEALPHAGGVADPFHVIRLANNPNCAAWAAPRHNSASSMRRSGTERSGTGGHRAENPGGGVGSR